VCMLSQRQVFIAMPRTLNSAFILTWANKVVGDLNKIKSRNLLADAIRVAVCVGEEKARTIQRILFLNL
jgi:hypothetical protein